MSPLCSHESIVLSADRTSCECAPGYTLTNGLCTPCYPGTFKPTDGPSACKPCEDGVVSEEFAAASCTPCNAGQRPVDAHDACQPCQPGKYSPSQGLKECLDCQVLQYSLQGEPQCTSCPPQGVSCERGILERLPGFWRDDEQTRITAQTFFHECPNSDSCLLDSAGNHTVCAFGYTG